MKIFAAERPNVPPRPRLLNFVFFNQFTVVFHAFMAGFFVFVPLRMVLADQVQQVFFRFDVSNAGKVVNIAVANLASIFHLTQSALQQQII